MGPFREQLLELAGRLHASLAILTVAETGPYGPRDAIAALSAEEYEFREHAEKRGIGQALVRRTHEAAGLDTTLVLLAAPAAREYYGKIGMTRHESCSTSTGPARVVRR